MILEDYPAGHGFVWRDLVEVEISEYAPPPASGTVEGKGEKSQKKFFSGERRGVSNFEVKIKTA